MKLKNEKLSLVSQEKSNIDNFYPLYKIDLKDLELEQYFLR